MNKQDVLCNIRLLAVVLAILLIVGCGSKQPAAPESQTNREETKTEGFGVVSENENQLLAIQNSNHPDAIEGEYIIIFNENSGESQSRSSNKTSVIDSAQTEITAGGGEIQRQFPSFNGFSAKLSPAAVESLRSNPNVRTIEANMVVMADDRQDNPPNWGLDRIDHRQLPMDNRYEYLGSGSGVTAYILDTGIRANHSEFNGRVLEGYTAVNDGYGWGDCAGHGTHVAGTVAGRTVGVAPGANLVSVRVLNCQNSGTLDGILAGLDWLKNNAVQPAVANMSLSLGNVSTTFDDAVRSVANSGITIANSAGNRYGSDACNYSPQPVAEVITVGSTDRNDNINDFSNVGTCVDIFAPGGDIYSASNDGDTLYETMSGTSMATPHVAGCAARYLSEFPTATSQEVINALISEVVSENVVNGNLKGSPNKMLHCNFTEIHSRLDQSLDQSMEGDILSEAPSEPVATEVPTEIPTETPPTVVPTTTPSQTSTADEPAESYFIQNVRYGRFLDDDNGNAETSSTSTTWEMTVVGSSGSNDVVTFKNNVTGDYLSYQNREARTSSNADTSEQWILKPLGNDTYHIASVIDSMQNLDADSSRTGYDVDTAQKTNGDKQWRILPASGVDAVSPDSLITISGDNSDLYGEDDGDEEDELLPTAVTLTNQTVTLTPSLLILLLASSSALVSIRITRR